MQLAKHPHDTYRSLAESNRWRKERQCEERAYSDGRSLASGGGSSRVPSVGGSMRGLNDMLTCCTFFSTDAAGGARR